MKKRKIKRNVFLTLLGSAAKSAASCILALLLLGILENVTTRRRVSATKKLMKSARSAKTSIEDKVSKWR